MHWRIEQDRLHDGIQYWIIQPSPIDVGDQDLMDNWRVHLEVNNSIIHTFFDVADPVINNMMEGDRGVKWEYEPVIADSEWPNQIVIYEINKDNE